MRNTTRLKIALDHFATVGCDALDYAALHGFRVWRPPIVFKTTERPSAPGGHSADTRFVRRRRLGPYIETADGRWVKGVEALRELLREAGL